MLYTFLSNVASASYAFVIRHVSDSFCSRRAAIARPAESKGRDASMNPHSEQMMRDFKFASVMMEYQSLRTNAGLEARRLPSQVPQFLLLGNQSSGKTTILQRMTKLPLGVTGTVQGTCRPFQFTLIHDPNQEGHVIQVDGEDVARENLLEKLRAKNFEFGGFNARRVNVTIRSKHVTSLIVVDMPGLSARSDAPREMALAELEDPSAIPILVLPSNDPGSADPARQAFDALLDGRETPAVAIVNKFDEKIWEAASELGSGAKWNQWVESWHRQTPEQMNRYSAWFMVGVPPGDPKEDLVTRLTESHAKEELLIQQWRQRCGPEALWPEPIKFGLASFEEFVHKQQAERLSSFVANVRPLLLDLQDKERALMPRKHEGYGRLLKQLAFVVTEGQTIWQGQLASGLFSQQVKKTLQQELEWLKSQSMSDRAFSMMHMLETGDWQQAVGPRDARKEPLDPSTFPPGASGSSDRQISAARLRMQTLQFWLVDTVYTSETHLLGLTASTRFADCIERFAFVCLWLHTTANYDLEFFRNSVSNQQHQTANNAIREYKKAMCARVFRPLAELMKLMLQEQFVRSMDAPFDSEQKDQRPWFQEMQKHHMDVEEIRKTYRQEVAVEDIAEMCGKEFDRMMGSDIQTLESALVHAFSDDESANFVRRNQVLGESANFARRGSVQYQYSPEALGRRFLATFVKQVKETSSQHLGSLRHEAEQAVTCGAITMPVTASAHEVADYFRACDGVEPYVISEQGYRCISAAPTWNQLFAGPSLSPRPDFRRLHLVSPPISSREFCDVKMEIFGHTNYFWGPVLPSKVNHLFERKKPYCGVLLLEAESRNIIQAHAATRNWTEVSFKIPESHTVKYYQIHIVDFEPRGIACRRLVCKPRRRESVGYAVDLSREPRSPPAPASSASALAPMLPRESGCEIVPQSSPQTPGALAQIMRSEVAVSVDSHPQNDHEEAMFHELHSRITLEMASTLKQFHADLHKNISKFREDSYGRAPYFIDGLGRSLKGLQEDQEQENRLTVAQICYRLMLIDRAFSLVETGAAA